MRKIVDVISLVLIAIAFFAMAALNIFQTDRPTESLLEQRKLAEIPELSFDGIKDGSYFKGIEEFVSDTFYKRNDMVTASKRIKLLFGVNMDNSFVLLGNENDRSEETDFVLPDSVIDALTNKETTVSETVEEDIPETTVAEEKKDETIALETETDIPETTAPELEVILDKTEINIITGSGMAVYASFNIDSGNTEELSWKISENIATISPNAYGGIDLMGISAGTAVLRATASNGAYAECVVNVTAPSGNGEKANVADADFVTSSLFLYGDAAYSNAYYSASGSKAYATTAAYYAALFPSARMNTLVIPLSYITIDDQNVLTHLNDQKKYLENLDGFMDDSVNNVQVYDVLYEHRKEYLYYKSDHHWNARGAYYAYAAFAESVGLEPTPLENFEYKIASDSYNGSMYTYTHDERVKTFVDVIEVFVPTKKHTMTIYNNDGSSRYYDSSVNILGKSYAAAFISGDNAYTVINVPENPQDFNILVLKDSFGCALVPFLCEHYGNIIVIDPRKSTYNLYDMFKDYALSDILFVNNIESANNAAWARMYLEAVGVSTN